MKKILITVSLFMYPTVLLAGTVTVQIPPQIKQLKLAEISDYFKQLENLPLHEHIEIKIYNYSSGVEVLTLNTDTITEKTGEIKALVKLRSRGNLIKALFISANGENKQKLLQNLAHNIMQALSGQRSFSKP